MKRFQNVAVDTNVLLSACFGGRAGRIIQHERVRFMTTQFNQDEALEHVRKLLQIKPKYRQAGFTEEQLSLALFALPVDVFTDYHYKGQLQEAKKRIAHLDPDDVPLLALALEFKAVIWSNDDDFTTVGIERLTSAQMVKALLR